MQVEVSYTCGEEVVRDEFIPSALLLDNFTHQQRNHSTLTPEPTSFALWFVLGAIALSSYSSKRRMLTGA